jgi:predicted dehydrogenase
MSRPLLDKTIYDIDYVDYLVENDEISAFEADFMREYDSTADKDIHNLEDDFLEVII